MISASAALKMGTSDLTLDRMLKIADQKVKEAVAEKKGNCVILFSFQIYSKIDIRNFKIEVDKLGYRVLDAGHEGGNSFCLELSW